MSTLVSPANGAPLTGAGPVSILGRLMSAASRYTSELAAWRRKQIAIAELERLDDRMLKDIGIARSDIRSIVYGGGGGYRSF